MYNIHHSCDVRKNFVFLVCSTECSGLEHKNINFFSEHARKYAYAVLFLKFNVLMFYTRTFCGTKRNSSEHHNCDVCCMNFIHHSCDVVHYNWKVSNGRSFLTQYCCTASTIWYSTTADFNIAAKNLRICIPEFGPENGLISHFSFLFKNTLATKKQWNVLQGASTHPL